jgi:hypothetical protein
MSRPVPTRGKRARAAEAAAASAVLADAGPRSGPTRRQLEATIRTTERNAAEMEQAGFVVAAARCRAHAERHRERLAAR